MKSIYKLCPILSIDRLPWQNTEDAMRRFGAEESDAEADSNVTTWQHTFEASLSNLDSWDRDWERKHMEHADPAHDECEFVTYGDLNNDVRPFAEEPQERQQDETWSWDEPSDTEILFRCCGEDRPLGKRGLVLEVRPSPGNDFVTVKDYVGGEFDRVGCMYRWASLI
jgi:hypothetical protein